MSGIRGRLERLEAVSCGRVCETCGFDGDWSNVGFVTEVRGIGESEETGPRSCPECKFPFVIKVMGDGSKASRASEVGRG